MVSTLYIASSFELFVGLYWLLKSTMIHGPWKSIFFLRFCFTQSMLPKGQSKICENIFYHKVCLRVYANWQFFLDDYWLTWSSMRTVIKSIIKSILKKIIFSPSRFLNQFQIRIKNYGSQDIGNQSLHITINLQTTFR